MSFLSPINILWLLSIGVLAAVIWLAVYRHQPTSTLFLWQKALARRSWFRRRERLLAFALGCVILLPLVLLLCEPAAGPPPESREVVFVIDGVALQHDEAAVEKIVQEKLEPLSNADRVGVVYVAAAPELLLRLGGSKSEVLSALDDRKQKNVEGNNACNLSEGLLIGYSMLTPNVKSPYIQRPEQLFVVISSKAQVIQDLQAADLKSLPDDAKRSWHLLDVPDADATNPPAATTPFLLAARKVIRQEISSEVADGSDESNASSRWEVIGRFNNKPAEIDVQPSPEGLKQRELGPQNAEIVSFSLAKNVVAEVSFAGNATSESKAKLKLSETSSTDKSWPEPLVVQSTPSLDDTTRESKPEITSTINPAMLEDLPQQSLPAVVSHHGLLIWVVVALAGIALAFLIVDWLLYHQLSQVSESRS